MSVHEHHYPPQTMPWITRLLVNIPVRNVQGKVYNFIQICTLSINILIFYSLIWAIRIEKLTIIQLFSFAVTLISLIHKYFIQFVSLYKCNLQQITHIAEPMMWPVNPRKLTYFELQYDVVAYLITSTIFKSSTTYLITSTVEQVTSARLRGRYLRR